jgi:hypothetical protein
MSKIRILAAAALMALGGGAHAADVALDGSPAPGSKPTLASTANRQLQQADVPSVKTDPASLKAKADADIAERNTRGRRLQVQRQNLKGDAAAREIAAHTTPNTIDHDTAYGDKDHTEQVTDLKLTLKKKGAANR